MTPSDKSTFAEPQAGGLFRAIIGLMAIATGIIAMALLFFVEIPPRNENALMLALGILIGWGTAVMQSEYGASTTGRRVAESAIKKIEERKP